MRRNENAFIPADDPLPDLLKDHAPTLWAARETSQQLLAGLARALTQNAGALAGIETVIAAGSLGRLETHAGSDFDGILIARPGGPSTVPGDMFDIVAACGLKPPKADGIYRATITAETLCRLSARGSLDEPPAHFGKRMQVLLDARAVTGEAAFRQLQREILDWYAGDSISRYPDAQWTLLINDLSRYLHAYAGWQQFKCARSDDDGWYLRQAKLRGSRMLTFAGLLLLLGESSVLGADKRAWVAARLGLSPLARVAAVMQPRDAAAFQRVLTDYEAVHALLATPAVREELVARSPGPDAPADGEFPASYARIHEHSGRLLRELSQFVLARRADWHPDFFSYLLF